MRLTRLWLLLCLVPADLGLAQPLEQSFGQVAVWHHGRAVVKNVALPQSLPGRVLATPTLQVSPLPDGLVLGADNCLCYDVSDDRLAAVHAYYYAYTALSNYNQILRELKLPQIRDVTLSLIKDTTMPTVATTTFKKHPSIVIRYSSPTIDPFIIDREIGRIILQSLLPHFRWNSMMDNPLSPRLAAEEEGVEEGTANILAALELGAVGNVAQTSDTLDAPVAQDVDSFVRLPDLVVTRRQVAKEITQAPRFAARYSSYVAKLLRTLDDTARADYLNQLDPNMTSALINQPLWQVAVRYGFRSAKILVLRALAAWSSPDYSYVAYGRELVMQAHLMGPKWADFLSEEYQRRGLQVPDARLELRPQESTGTAR